MSFTPYYTCTHEFRNYVYVGYTEKEIWTYIKNENGEDSKYLISNFGHICHEKRPNKMLKHAHFKNDNHHVISLRLNGGKAAKNYLVHRLVAMYFVPLPDKHVKDGLSFKDLQVHHKDGDPNNNCFKNLMWVTQSEHLVLSYELEQRDRKFGEGSPNAKYTLKQYMKVGKLLEENKLSPKAISENTGVSVPAILAFINGETLWPEVRVRYDIELYDKKRHMIEEDTMENAFKMISSNKYTIKQVMKETGLSRGTISELINGKISKKWRYLLKYYDISKFSNFSIRKNVLPEKTRKKIKEMVFSGVPTSKIISDIGLEKSKYTYSLISQYRQQKRKK